MAKGSGSGGRGSARRGSFVTDGLVRGFVTGRGSIGRGRNSIPVYRVNIGGGRTTVIPINQIRVLYP